MTQEVLVVWIVFVLTAGLFLSGRIAPDVVALLALTAVLLTGVLAPQDAFSSFVDPAPVTVACMFVLSEALVRTGVVDSLGSLLERRVHRSPARLFLCLVLVVLPASAFVNNTPVVVLFLPVVLRMAGRIDVPASKLLIPLSYLSILGGTCTLIGTSTNILVSSLYTQHELEVPVDAGGPLEDRRLGDLEEEWAGRRVAVGVSRNDAALPPAADLLLRAGDRLRVQPMGFSMFELSKLGLVLAAVGVVYLATVGKRLLPVRPSLAGVLTRSGYSEYLTEIRIQPGSQFVGAALGETTLGQRQDVRVVELIRGEEVLAPGATTVLEDGDVLLVSGSANTLYQLDRERGVEVLPELLGGHGGGEKVRSVELTMAEVVIRPGSRWIGQRLREVSFRARYHVSVFAILRHGAHLREKIGRVTLRMGDVLLVQGTPDAIQGLRVLDDLILVDEVRHHLHRKERGPVALGVMAAVVVLASLGVLPVAVLAFAGALLVILTRCVTRKEAYASIDWSIIALIGGTIALGRAMDATHAARVLVETVLGWVARWSGGLDPRMVTLAALFVLTNAATEVMSNAAAAALLTPLAIAAAESFGIDPRPFVVTVAFAASCSFATPIGYQTNTFVYGPGGYRFTDFARVGLPLNVAVFVLAALLIPVLWPFENLA